LFLSDYQNSINNVSKVVKNNGIVCYVVGNRRVKDVQIPLDYITVEFFENNGFEHLNTFVRRIPNKRMPSKNSPSNKAGELASTMVNEYIVVLKKRTPSLRT
jgi:DNA modification methylase